MAYSKQQVEKALKEVDQFYAEKVTRTCSCGKTITAQRGQFPYTCPNPKCGKKLPDPRRDK